MVMPLCGEMMIMIIIIIMIIIKRKDIPVTGRGGLYGCERSRLPHFFDKRLTDGGEAVSLTSQPPFNPTKNPGTHFSQRLCLPQGHSAAGRIR
jgi:hypothetical protein